MEKGQSSNKPKLKGEMREKVKTCDTCGKKFVSKENLTRHIRTLHSNVKPHHCDEHGCDKKFARRDSLSMHKKTVHSMEEPYNHCEDCGKGFKHKGSLDRHIRSVHSDERPLQCEEPGCDKK